MERRSLVFVLFGMSVFFTMILMQNLTSKNEAEQEQVTAADETDGEAGENSQQDPKASNSGDSEKNEADKDGSKESDQKTEDSGKGEKAKSDPKAESSDTDPNQPQLKASDDTNTGLVPNIESELTAESEFYQLGSLDPATNQKFLAVFDAKGATLVSVELAARKANGKYKYRELNYTAGYMGFLALQNKEKGCTIGIVGNGTPAAKKGLQKNDVIVKINGDAITSRDEYFERLEEKDCRPESEITVSVLRPEGDNWNPLDFKVTLTEKPLALVKPEPDELKIVPDPPLYSDSYRISIRKPGDPFAVWPHLDETLLDGVWTAPDPKNDKELVFEKKISSDSLSKEGIDYTGEIIVRKKFRLPQPPAEKEDFSRTYHLDFDIEINRVGGTADDQFCLQVNGPTGLTLEGWWYTNKIHGSSTALFKGAGTRDVVLQTSKRYNFFGCPQIYKKARRESKGKSPPYQFDLNTDLLGPNATDEDRTLKFAGLDTIYFANALLAKPDSPFVMHNIYVAPRNAIGKDTDSIQKKTNVSYRAYSKPFSIAPGEKHTQSFEIFLGPKDSQLLPKYELSELQAYGWFAIFSKILLVVLHFFYSILRNYGIAIILLTVLVRLGMMPISRKAAKNAQMMQLLGPEMKAIAEKYKDDMEKRGQAQRELFKRYNYNPFGGCLLMFFQLPIFIGLYRGLSVDTALRDQPLIPGVEWCSNLAAPDQLLYWKEILPIGFLTSETGFLGPYLNVLPLITIVLFIMQQKLFTPPPTDEQQAMTQKMMSFMMIFMGFLFFKVPAGLCLYFITSSLWGIAERKLLPKPELDKEKIQAMANEAGDSENKSKPKSKMPSSFLGIELPNQKPKTTMTGDERKQRDKDRQRRLREKKRGDS